MNKQGRYLSGSFLLPWPLLYNNQARVNVITCKKQVENFSLPIDHTGMCEVIIVGTVNKKAGTTFNQIYDFFV